MSTPPTTPSTADCDSPDWFCATPDTAFKFLTREVQPEPEHPLNERLGACFEEAPAREESSRKVAFGTEENEVRLFSRTTEERNQMLEEWYKASLLAANDCRTDVEVSLRSTADEKDASFSHTGSCAISKTGVTMGKLEELMFNLDHAILPGLADRDAFAISEMIFGNKEEERTSIVDAGKISTDSQAGHRAVAARNKIERKAKVSPCRFIDLDCRDPRADSETALSEVNATKSVDSDSIVSDFITESHFKKVKGAKSFGTESTMSTWEGEDESSGTNTTEGLLFADDVRYMLSDLGATFAKAGWCELTQRLYSCSTDCSQTRNRRRETRFPNPDDNTIEISWMSQSSDVDTTISSLDSSSDYGSVPTQDSPTFCLDVTAKPKINSIRTRETSRSRHRASNEHKKEQSNCEA
jgi:hypothetical protein